MEFTSLLMHDVTQTCSNDNIAWFKNSIFENLCFFCCSIYIWAVTYSGKLIHSTVFPSFLLQMTTSVTLCLVVYICSYRSKFMPLINSLTTEKQTTKFSSPNFQKMLSPSYIILRIQRLEGKQCRSRWGGSLWATSSRSTLFANSAIFVTGS